MTDHYLQNPSELNGQPKRTIADYVASNGILVPRRFDSLAEARRSHRPVFLRSEHVQEYDGVSGLLESFRLSEELMSSGRGDHTFSPRGMGSLGEVKEAYIDFENNQGYPHFRVYCDLLGIDEDEFISGVTFSLWEKLNGYNRTVVVDTAIDGRYHVFSTNLGESPNLKNLANYTVVEDGQIKHSLGMPLPDELEKSMSHLIEMYDAVRSLPNFDQSHCPIMEFQTVGKRNYFLQYHRARDSKPAEFVIDREVMEGEVSAFMVRGATSPDGIVVNVTAMDASWNSRDDDAWYIPETEEGSFDNAWWKVPPEIQVRKRTLQVLETRTLDSLALELATDHALYSQLFKPEISAVVGRGSFIEDHEWEGLLMKTRETKEDQKIPIHIVSDGTNAYLRRA